MLSEFSDFFRTPYVDQHAKEVPKNIVFGGAPFRCPAKVFKDTVGYKKYHKRSGCDHCAADFSITGILSENKVRITTLVVH